MNTKNRLLNADAVDADALAAAQEMLGAPTPEDAVNEALRHEVKRKLVERYLERMASTVHPLDLREAAWRH